MAAANRELGMQQRGDLSRQGPARDASGEAVVRSLQVVVGEFLPAGYPSVRQAADSINVSVRTLQRCLERLGLTYRDLVERHRFGEACKLLEQTELRVSVVAARLGYRDASHFSRAFRRWSGHRPTEYRRARKP